MKPIESVLTTENTLFSLIFLSLLYPTLPWHSNHTMDSTILPNYKYRLSGTAGIKSFFLTTGA